jgi:hypothetical protein
LPAGGLTGAAVVEQETNPVRGDKGAGCIAFNADEEVTLGAAAPGRRFEAERGGDLVVVEPLSDGWAEGCHRTAGFIDESF